MLDPSRYSHMPASGDVDVSFIELDWPVLHPFVQKARPGVHGRSFRVFLTFAFFRL